MFTRRHFICGLASCAAGFSSATRVGPDIRAIRLPGVDFLHRNSATSQKYLIETMCGGVALFDYNNDGLLDIFFVNGGHLDDPVKMPARFLRSDPVYWNRLYRQNKDGSFGDVTRQAGLHRESDCKLWHGCRHR